MVDEIKLPIGIDDIYAADLKIMQTKFALASVAIVGTLASIGAGLFDITKKTAEAGDTFQKMSERTTISVKTLSEFSHVAKIAGTDIETIEKGVRKMQRSMSDADNGLATAKRTWEQLGISIYGVDGNLKDTEQVFLEVINALRNFEDPTKKAALAMEVFGRTGSNLLNISTLSAQEVDNLRQEAERLGITFNEVSGKQAADFQDALTRVKESAEGASHTIGKGLIPLLTDFFNLISGVDAEKFDYVKSLNLEETKVYLEDQKIRLADINIELNHGKRTNIDIVRELRAQKAETESLITAAQRQLDTLNKQKEVQSQLAESSATTPDTSTYGSLPLFGGENFTDELEQLNIDLENLVKSYFKNREDLRDEAIATEYQQYTESMNAEWLAEVELTAKLGNLAADRYEYEEKLRQQNLEAIKKNEALKLAAAQSGAASLVTIFENLNTLTEEQNEGYFDLLKAARISEATINTYTGATRALAEFPYPYSLVVAGLIVAAGLSNIAVIASQQFDGGGSTTTTTTSGSTTTTTTGTDSVTSTTTDTTETSPTYYITIYNPLGTEDWDEITEKYFIPSTERAAARNL